MTTAEAKPKPVKPLDKLFYCHSEKVVFWVAGYTEDCNTRKVVEQTKSLTENAQRFATFIGCRIEQVLTDTVRKSTKYKYQRVFWIESPEVPAGAFELGEGWDMWKWLTN